MDDNDVLIETESDEGYEFVRKAIGGDPTGKSSEVTTIDYTPCTSPHPIDAKCLLRPKRASRKTRLFIVVTCYNEEGDELRRSLTGIASNLTALQAVGLHWSEIAVLIIIDGREKVNCTMIDELTGLSLFDGSLLKESHHGRPVVLHLFERTVELPRHATQRLYFPPLQIALAIKEKNGGKLNSHLWAFTAFASSLNPKYVLTLDVGTVPLPDSLVRMYSAMEENPQYGGAAGEIRVRNMRPWKWLDSVQSFEYSASHTLDKAAESCCGYVQVLPGAFSLYRWVAIRGEPLASYFRVEETRLADLTPLVANQYLAEDRLLGIEIVARPQRRWTLAWVNGAVADTDTPQTFTELVRQRRRWINGSLFSSMYYFSHFQQLVAGAHAWHQKALFSLQFVFLLMTTFLSFFNVSMLLLSLLLIYGHSIEHAPLLQTELRSAFIVVYILLLFSQLLQALLGGHSPKLEQFYLVLSLLYALMMGGAFCLSLLLVCSSSLSPFVIAGLLGSLGSYFVAAILFGRLGNTLLTFVQYTLAIPLFVNVFTLYSIANVSDISWGTKSGGTQTLAQKSHERKAQVAARRASVAKAKADALESMTPSFTNGQGCGAASSASMRRREVGHGFTATAVSSADPSSESLTSAGADGLVSPPVHRSYGHNDAPAAIATARGCRLSTEQLGEISGVITDASDQASMTSPAADTGRSDTHFSAAPMRTVTDVDASSFTPANSGRNGATAAAQQPASYALPRPRSCSAPDAAELDRWASRTLNADNGSRSSRSQSQPSSPRAAAAAAYAMASEASADAFSVGGYRPTLLTFTAGGRPGTSAESVISAPGRAVRTATSSAFFSSAGTVAPTPASSLQLQAPVSLHRSMTHMHARLVHKASSHALTSSHQAVLARRAETILSPRRSTGGKGSVLGYPAVKASSALAQSGFRRSYNDSIRSGAGGSLTSDRFFSFSGSIGGASNPATAHSAASASYFPRSITSSSSSSSSSIMGSGESAASIAHSIAMKRIWHLSQPSSLGHGRSASVVSRVTNASQAPFLPGANVAATEGSRGGNAYSAAAASSSANHTGNLSNGSSGSSRMKFISADHGEASFVAYQPGLRDVALSMDVAALTDAARQLCAADEDTKRRERAARARRLQQAQEQAAERESRLAAELEADKKRMAEVFNEFRIRFLLCWVVANVFLASSVMIYDPSLQRFAQAVTASIVFQSAFKLLGAFCYQLSALVRYIGRTCCLRCSYRVEKDPRGRPRVVCCWRSKTYYALDDLFEAEHPYEHVYPEGYGELVRRQNAEPVPAVRITKSLCFSALFSLIPFPHLLVCLFRCRRVQGDAGRRGDGSAAARAVTIRLLTRRCQRLGSEQ